MAPIGDAAEDAQETVEQEATASSKTLNAFNFLRVAGHFFRDFEFEDYKVDEFVQDILKLVPFFRKSDLHRCLHENLKVVKDYRDRFLLEDGSQTFSPYTTIRHSLYLCDQETFRRILSNRMRERFAEWLKTCGSSA